MQSRAVACACLFKECSGLPTQQHSLRDRNWAGLVSPLAENYWLQPVKAAWVGPTGLWVGQEGLEGPFLFQAHTPRKEGAWISGQAAGLQSLGLDIGGPE